METDSVKLYTLCHRRVQWVVDHHTDHDHTIHPEYFNKSHPTARPRSKRREHTPPREYVAVEMPVTPDPQEEVSREVQTEATEQNASTQADLPSQCHQAAQTEEVEEVAEWGDTCSSRGSSCAGSFQSDFPQVLTLWSTPLSQDITHLEERAYRVSRWLEECSGGGETTENNGSSNHNSPAVSYLHQPEPPAKEERKPSPAVTKKDGGLKRFNDYLKGQHHHLEGDFIGKSHMMIQDLKVVLQKRGVSN